MCKKRFWRFSLPALLMTSSCATLIQPKTVTPIVYEAEGDPATAQSLVILLPGIRDRMRDFRSQGFISIAQPYLDAEPGTALLAVDAHWGYYRERSIDERLQQDILDPFADARMTFTGISLGGFGATLMAMREPQRTQRLILLSPFLGADDYEYLERLRTQGPVDLAGDEDLETALNRVWRYLLDPQRSTPVVLAYGESDRFAPYYEHLRSLDPPRLEFIAIRGAHTWDTWRSLWIALAPLAIQGNSATQP